MQHKRTLYFKNFENNKEESFTEGVKQEKKKYEWTTFIDAFVGLYNKVK